MPLSCLLRDNYLTITHESLRKEKPLKTKAIESLFTGNSIPYEAVPPEAPEYRTLMDECRQCEEKLLHKLPPEIKDELEHIQNCRQNALQYEIQKAFVQGYSLGVRLTAESFLADP